METSTRNSPVTPICQTANTTPERTSHRWWTWRQNRGNKNLWSETVPIRQGTTQLTASATLQSSCPGGRSPTQTKKSKQEWHWPNTTEEEVQRHLQILRNPRAQMGRMSKMPKRWSSWPQQCTGGKSPRTSESKPTVISPEIQCQIVLPNRRVCTPVCKRWSILEPQHVGLWERALLQANNHWKPGFQKRFPPRPTGLKPG